VNVRTDVANYYLNLLFNLRRHLLLVPWAEKKISWKRVVGVVGVVGVVELATEAVASAWLAVLDVGLDCESEPGLAGQLAGWQDSWK
jgi:hypothetical protein